MHAHRRRKLHCRTMSEEPRPQPVEASSPSSPAPPGLAHVRFFDQLKQRNVFRVAALYLVVCWVILEPVHVVFHMLDVPVWADRLVIIVMALGFPAVSIGNEVCEGHREQGHLQGSRHRIDRAGRYP